MALCFAADGETSAPARSEAVEEVVQLASLAVGGGPSLHGTVAGFGASRALLRDLAVRSRQKVDAPVPVLPCCSGDQSCSR